MAASATRTRATFGKHEHLRGDVRIRTVMREGRKVHVPPFRLSAMVMELPANVPLQVAFAVPKRAVPGAPQRNRMKRLMREAWRTNKAPYTERVAAAGVQVALLLAFNGSEPVTLAETVMKITRALDRWIEGEALRDANDRPAAADA